MYYYFRYVFTLCWLVQTKVKNYREFNDILIFIAQDSKKTLWLFKEPKFLFVSQFLTLHDRQLAGILDIFLFPYDHISFSILLRGDCYLGLGHLDYAVIWNNLIIITLLIRKNLLSILLWYFKYNIHIFNLPILISFLIRWEFTSADLSHYY